MYLSCCAATCDLNRGIGRLLGARLPEVLHELPHAESRWTMTNIQPDSESIWQIAILWWTTSTTTTSASTRKSSVFPPAWRKWRSCDCACLFQLYPVPDNRGCRVHSEIQRVAKNDDRDWDCLSQLLPVPDIRRKRNHCNDEAVMHPRESRVCACLYQLLPEPVNGDTTCCGTAGIQSLLYSFAGRQKHGKEADRCDPGREWLIFETWVTHTSIREFSFEEINFWSGWHASEQWGTFTSSGIQTLLFFGCASDHLSANRYWSRHLHDVQDFISLTNSFYWGYDLIIRVRRARLTSCGDLIRMCHYRGHCLADAGIEWCTTHFLVSTTPSISWRCSLSKGTLQPTPADLEIVRNVKDQLFQHALHVLISSSHQQRKVSGKTYELADWNFSAFGAGLFRGPKVVLFPTSLHR